MVNLRRQFKVWHTFCVVCVAMGRLPVKLKWDRIVYSIIFCPSIYLCLKNKVLCLGLLLEVLNTYHCKYSYIDYLYIVCVCVCVCAYFH